MANTIDNMNRCGVAWFKMDEISGNLIDSKGDFVGTNNGTTVVTGINGNARSFNGTSNYVQFNDAIIPVGNKSIRYRLKTSVVPASGRWAFIFSNQNSSSRNGLTSVINPLNGVLTFQHWVNGSMTGLLKTEKNICDGQWHDVLYSQEGSIIKLYIDNVLTDSSTVSNEVFGNSNMRFGRDTGSGSTSWYNGQLDEFEVYNDVISPIPDKALVFSDNSYKYYTTSWQSISSTVTQSDYITYGMNDISIIPESAWSELSGNVELSIWTDAPNKTEASFNIETEPFTLSQEWDGKQIQVIEYSDNPNVNESSIVLKTDPFTLEDYLSGSNKLDVLYYTDEENAVAPTLETTINYSPLDELNDFEVVTWISDEEQKASIHMNALPFGQIALNVNDLSRYIDIKSFAASIESTAEELSLTRFFLSFDEGLSWKSYRNSYWRDVDLTKKEAIKRYAMSINDLNSIPESAINSMINDKFQIGYYIEERAWTDEDEKITEVGYKGTAYVDDVKFSDLTFNVLNTKATINVLFAGNKVQGILDDEDKGKVQYRILLNGDPYFPENGEFSNLLPSPFQLNVVVDDKRIKFGVQNTLIVEFKDYWGEVDSWSSTFIGTHSGLVFTDEMGNFYTTAFGEVLKYLDFGQIIAGQTTIDQKVILKNNIGYPVKNVQLTARHADSDVAIEMSKGHSPFEAHSELLYPGVLDINEEIPFYVRVSTKLTASPNANGEFEIRLNADRVI